MLILLLGGVCLACAGLPQIKPAADAPLPQPCRIFPQGEWQLLHSIKAEFPGGGSFMSLGLTVMSSRDRSHRSVVMTFEGFSLFDGEYRGEPIVHRALPPFDSPHFAGGLMEDIRLVFFEPEGPVIAAGLLANGSFAQRHPSPDGGVVDLAWHPDGTWELRRYGPDHRLNRSVRASGPCGSGAALPERVELRAHGNPTYKLVMTLVEAVAIDRPAP